MGQRFLVIGANSFSGSNFVNHLLASGREVHGVSRSAQPADVFLPHRWRGRSGYVFHQLDLNEDTTELGSLLKGLAPTHVVNFAAQSMVAQSWQHPEHWYQTNVVGMVKLAELLRQCASLARYVHVSTPEVYGSCDGNIAEHTHYNPSTPYATSRAAADMHMANLHRNFGFPVVFTRAANVYGPGQQLYRIVPRAVLCILLGRRLPLDGGGRAVRSFIHIDDVSAATLAIAERGVPPSIFHLSTARVVAIRELVELICQRMSAHFEDVVTMSDERPGKDFAYVLDSSRARTELGWHDRISLEDGLDQTIRWARDNLAALERQPWHYVHKP